MKTPADIANDNGTPEERLAAITLALCKAVEGLYAPAEVIADALAALPVSATQPPEASPVLWCSTE
jgi:hypothetical protein